MPIVGGGPFVGSAIGGTVAANSVSSNNVIDQSLLPEDLDSSAIAASWVMTANGDGTCSWAAAGGGFDPSAVAESIIPDTSVAYDLGSTSFKFDSIWARYVNGEAIRLTSNASALSDGDITYNGVALRFADSVMTREIATFDNSGYLYSQIITFNGIKDTNGVVRIGLTGSAPMTLACENGTTNILSVGNAGVEINGSPIIRGGGTANRIAVCVGDAITLGSSALEYIGSAAARPITDQSYDLGGSVYRFVAIHLMTAVLYGTGSGSTTFSQAANGDDITYKLPVSDGSNGQVLTHNGAGGQLSWETPSGGGGFDPTASVTIIPDGGLTKDLGTIMLFWNNGYIYNLLTNNIKDDTDVNRIEVNSAGTLAFLDSTGTERITFGANSGNILPAQNLNGSYNLGSSSYMWYGIYADHVVSYYTYAPDGTVRLNMGGTSTSLCDASNNPRVKANYNGNLDLYNTTGGAVVLAVSDGYVTALDDSKGFVIKDSGGHYWNLQISVLGVITTVDLGTSQP